MIANTSRYADSKLVTMDKNGKTIQVIVPSRSTTYTFNYIQHTMKGVERLDNISYAFYGDATYWWKIGDANPEILDWSIFPSSGITVRVPNA